MQLQPIINHLLPWADSPPSVLDDLPSLLFHFTSQCVASLPTLFSKCQCLLSGSWTQSRKTLPLRLPQSSKRGSWRHSAPVLAKMPRLELWTGQQPAGTPPPETSSRKIRQARVSSVHIIIIIMPASDVLIKIRSVRACACLRGPSSQNCPASA